MLTASKVTDSQLTSDDKHQFTSTQMFICLSTCLLLTLHWHIKGLAMVSGLPIANAVPIKMYDSDLVIAVKRLIKEILR